MESITGVLFLLMLVLFILWLAFLPALIVKKKDSANKNFVIGLTILGLFIPLCWLVALIWSIMDAPSQPQKIILVKE